jgi:predicted TPR repeat methyltransferase
MRFYYVCLLLTITGFTVLTCTSKVDNDDNAEALFRQTVSLWQQSNRNNWQAWIELSQTLLLKRADNNQLELIAAMEETILFIERSTINDAANQARDAALSVLYTAYGTILSQLNAEACYQLAIDPHTLLIGSADSADLCVENAENSFRNAVALDATNVQAQVELNTITADSFVHKRKPREFVAELFDSFADNFNEKLARLNYQVPQLVGMLAQPSKAALDAGCGTGLSGRYLRPLVDGPMIGVDASQKMLALAAKCTITTGCGNNVTTIHDDNANNNKPLYDGLFAMDLEEMTLANTLHQVTQTTRQQTILDAFDMIVAADVLVYFGHLSNILKTFSNLSVIGAWLIFSCELATDKEAPLGWRLLPSGRFAHTKQHVVETATKAGYSLDTYKEIVPRLEKGENVRGHLFRFIKVEKQGLLTPEL